MLRVPLLKSNSNTKVSNHAKLSPINCSHQMQTHNNQFYNNYNILRYMMKIMLCFQQLYIYIFHKIKMKISSNQFNLNTNISSFMHTHILYSHHCMHTQKIHHHLQPIQKHNCSSNLRL